MRTPTTARRLALLVTGLLLLAACSDASQSADPVDLDGGDTEVTGDGDPDDGDTTEAPPEDAPNADDDPGDDTASDDPSTDASQVDTTEAVPGTWPVGDAGTVTFALADGTLVLEDVTAADGWRDDIDEQDPDEIEVDFRRDDVEWKIEIELKDGGSVLEIEIDQDIHDAEPGSYDIGDAGTVAFSVADGRLVLDDLAIADGWTLTELDEEADEIEIEVVDGPREYDVEIELEGDGSVEVEIDYEVVGPATS